MNDTQRLDFLENLVKLPTASFHFSDDDCGEIPQGFTIKVAESCLPEVQATAATFRKAVDAIERAMKRQVATFEHGN